MPSKPGFSTDLWNQAACTQWRTARERYRAALEQVGGSRLVQLDDWYHQVLPTAIAARPIAYIGLEELVEITQWKMHRGVFRPRNLVLVRSNAPGEVESISQSALAAAPDPTKPIALLSKLKGVGPATASAVVAAARPDVYPFFDDTVAGAIPEFGDVGFTLKEYARYSHRLRERAALLAVGCPTDGWTPHTVGQALWAAAYQSAG